MALEKDKKAMPMHEILSCAIMEMELMQCSRKAAEIVIHVLSIARTK